MGSSNVSYLVSRIISRLEARLGVRLLNRTTRRLSAIADFVLGAALPRFITRYPEVSVDLTVRDQLIDPTAEGVDVVIRLAATRDSELVSRNLAPARSILVASPAYLAAHGRPRTFASLREHMCLAYLSSTGPLPWRLKTGAGEVNHAVEARLVAGSGNVLTRAAVAGLGIVQTFAYHVTAELARGELEVLLEEHEPEPRMVHARLSRQKSAVPKVRAFIDFLVEVFEATRAVGKGAFPDRPKPGR